MERLCPVCNGLIQLKENCPVCGCPMEDRGSLDNFLGPYSPYEENDFFELWQGYSQFNGEKCIHLLYCPNCKRDVRLEIEQVLM